ncbi:MAG: hypothetical protein ACI9FG_000995 [Crocinitomicaceae bacterium]|jgi:hypothetical protein
MDKQTIIVTAAIGIALIFILWRCYIALRRYSCCGTCGCDLMTKKERKVFDARNSSKAEQSKEKPQS